MIPQSVKIGGVIYKVISVNKMPIVDNKQHTASIDYETATIELYNKRCQAQKEQSLWHEIIHAIACDRKLYDFFGGCDLEHEIIIDTLASGLHALVIDNPSLFSNTQ